MIGFRNVIEPRGTEGINSDPLLPVHSTTHHLEILRTSLQRNSSKHYHHSIKKESEWN